jgi:hypothetical protein
MERAIFGLFHISIVLVDDAKQMNDDHCHVLGEDQLRLEEKLKNKGDFQLLEMFEYKHPIISITIFFICKEVSTYL